MAEPAAAGRRLAAAAAAAVLLLALGALLWPHGRDRAGAIPLLVCDPSGRQDRVEAVYEPLARVLAAAAGRPVALQVLPRSGDLRAAAAAGPCFVLAPDGLALDLGRDGFAPVAVGRGPVPRNLRPRSVLVWRRAAGQAAEPWRTRPDRTVLGDTLSLCAGGVFALGGGRADPGLAAGPDPFDHGPVLHAARLGGFDYALVRQWDADRFLAAGVLDKDAWGVRELTPPVPDIVVMAARALPRSQRLAAGEALAAVGRDARGGEASDRLAAGLERLQLAGFNLLLDPDLDLVRGQLRGHWPPDAR
ncbi:MAG: hypothetical protein ABR506_10520 [Candidatus Krumholzibacteriia bacterium]